MRYKILLLLLFFASLPLILPAQDERGLETRVKGLGENVPIGRQYLVIIAIDKYQEWSGLQNPVKDALDIRDILVKRYYIDEVYELYDEKATKENILLLFYELQKKLEIHDSLLIFYAGHGHLDEKTNSGFYIPVDAGKDVFKQQNWLPNTQVRGIISRIKASHICLVSDSCFSGDILDTRRALEPDINNEYFSKAYALTSRQVLTSGAMEMVPDTSEFAQQFKMALEKNTRPYLDSLMLYSEIRLGVKKTIPLFGSLTETGHQQGASFILFLKYSVLVKEVEYASLQINIKMGGKLYIDNVFKMELNQGTHKLHNMQPGKYVVKIVYENGKIEKQEVVVQAGSMNQVLFTFRPQIEKQEQIQEAEKQYDLWDIHNLSVSLHSAFALPLFEMGELLSPFIFSTIFMDYVFFELGFISLSAQVGGSHTFHSKAADFPSANDLHIAGVLGGMGIGFPSPIHNPLSLLINLTGGYAVSILFNEFHEQTFFSGDPALLAILEGRYTLIDHLIISIKASYMTVIYIDSWLHEVQLGGGIGYRF